MEWRTQKLNCLLRLTVVLSLAALLQAQETPPDRGIFEVGVRGLAGDRASSKFNEYRHLEPGFFVQQFETRLDHLFQSNYFVEVQSRKFLESDQNLRFAVGKYGTFRFEARWNETPHDFTNTATTLFNQSSPGVYSIPTPTRTALQTAAINAPLALADAHSVDMSIARKLGSGILSYTPTANWTLQMQYSRESEQGFRPFGTTTNGFSNIAELPEPIDYRMHQAKAGAEYGNSRGGFQATYSASIFDNEISTLVWDNPFRTTDAAGASSRGRIALYPDNSAQGLSFAGAYNLTANTRVMASISPEWMRQNQPFLPFTINSALTTPQLPAASLDGSKQTMAMNYTVTSSPAPSIEFTARYRSFDYNNNTRSLTFANYVTADGSLSGLSRRSLPFGYDRRNVGLETAWQFRPKESVKVGYEWERFDRQHRDVARSIENAGFVSLEMNPRKWLLFRGTYRHAERDPQHYEANEEINPVGEGPFGMGQIEDLRKFDESARTRNQGDVLLQLDPTDRFSISASWGTMQDQFRESDYGLQHYKTYNSGVDLSYQLRPNVSVFTTYALERYRSDQRSRQRNPPSATAPINDTANNDWRSFASDMIHSIGVGFNATTARGRLNLETFYTLSMAKGNIATRALGNPAIPGFVVTSAQDYPETSNRFHQVMASLRYRLSNSVAPRLEYRYERYGRADFQISPMLPYMVALDSGTNTSFFLGADVPGYHVHILSFSLEYRF